MCNFLKSVGDVVPKALLLRAWSVLRVVVVSLSLLFSNPLRSASLFVLFAATMNALQFFRTARLFANPAYRVGGMSLARPAAPYMARRFYGAEGALTQDEVTQRVVNVVKAFDKVDEGKVTPESNFVSDLNLDSLDGVELVLALEEEFAVEIPDDAADKITSIPEAISYFMTNPHAK